MLSPDSDPEDRYMPHFEQPRHANPYQDYWLYVLINLFAVICALTAGGLLFLTWATLAKAASGY